ncbi:photosystem II PsbU protein [Galdieria sulphuraria]|uniref:Photosystem II 12 kDa extrinsic protein n=1 Tax=Galdieria sulphuraria TaxID=130081 RepID=D4NY63_GALSU|nr:photosystem II PsbU protein [Galdieria sulphuraria]ADD54621.1 chloroplast photosystem II U precursor [Galdieria sulphuraria]EME29916.1 photosystem II PsbU protein [Galdieria sulphuraria]|eukprot:XP_005706436.1 photosystem II PsbU protein [Galdieria sulphuraria]
MYSLNFVSSSFLKGRSYQIESSQRHVLKQRRRFMETSKSSKLLCTCSQSGSGNAVSRRKFLFSSLGVISSTVFLFSQAASASREYAGVGYLGGGDKVDINNANIRAYTKFPGFYPKLASLIVKNGPYKSVNDLYNIKGLTEDQRELIKKYEDRFVALDPAPEYEVDKFNNGLYR